MGIERFDSVWDAIEATQAEAENMRLRSSLMIAIQQHIDARKLTKAQAAAAFGITQPRVSDLERGEIDLFSLDTLVKMVATSGLDPRRAYAAGETPRELADMLEGDLEKLLQDGDHER